MRRPVLCLAALALVGLGILFALRQDPAPGGRAERKPEAVEEPVAPPTPQAAPPAAGPPWRLSGRVTSTDRTPIAGASVDIALRGTPWDGPPGTVPTDDTGAYEIDIGLFRSDEPVLAYVQAIAPGYQPTCGFCQIDPGPHGPVERTMNLVLRKGACVAGRVVDTNGRPIGGAQVTLVKDITISGMLFAASDGRFLIGAPAAVTCRVSAQAPGFRQGRSEEIAASPATAIDVGDIVLRDGGVVEGHVRYEDGKPAGGAQLETRVGRMIGPRVVTAADGSFRVTGLEEGQGRISLPDWVGSLPAPGTTFDASAKGILLTVPGGRIRLRLVDEKGDRVVGARELCFAGEARDNRWSNASADEEVSYFAPKGTLLLLVAEAEGRVPAERELEVPMDRNETEVVLRLPALSPSARLRIELDAPPGTPFQAWLYTPKARRQAVILRHDGASADAPVFGVPHGSWILELQAGDAHPTFFEPVEAPVEIAPDRETVVRLAAPALGRVRLEVKAEALFMTAYKGVLVRAEDGKEIALKEFAAGITWTGTLDANKPALARPLLRPGLYSVRIELPRHERFETTIRVDGAAVTDVVAEMVRLKE